MKEAYFVPPGRRDNQPQIRVRGATVEALGEPTVDYGKFDALLRRTLRVKSKRAEGKIGGTSQSGTRGLQVPFAHSFYVNAARCLSRGGQDALDEEILRQSFSLAQSVNHPGETATNLVLGFMLTSTIGACCLNLEEGAVEKVVDAVDFLQPVADKVLPVVSTAAGLYLYYQLIGNRRYISDDFVADPEIRRRYKEIIVFPGSAEATS